MPSRKIEKFIKYIQPRISYCATCQPYENGEIVWVLGRKVNLEEIFDEYDIPQELRDDVVAHLICKGCHRELCRYDDIGLKSKEELKDEQKRFDRWEKWTSKYKVLVDEFQETLEKNPYLGLSHKIGKQIYNGIHKFPSTTIHNEIWYRAIKVRNAKCLSSKDMFPNPFPDSEGRFNHYGQSVFYLSSAPNAAAEEVLDLQTEDLAWIQMFRIKNTPGILDLYNYIFEDDEAIPILALGLVNDQLRTLTSKKDSPWKPEYFIPRFIADCAKLRGLNGIIYYGAKHREKNLVLFNYHKKDIKPIGKPEIQAFSRWDFKRT